MTLFFNDVNGTHLNVGDRVAVLDNGDLEGSIPSVGDVLTVSELIDVESNYIEFNNGCYAFYGHRVLKLNFII